jgi:hypothetical protein
MVQNTGIQFLLINLKNIMNNFVNLIEFYSKKFNPYLTTNKKDKEISYEFFGDNINRLNVTIIVFKNWVNIYLGKKYIQVVEDINLFDEDKHLEVCKYLNLLFESHIEEIEFYRGNKVKCIEYHFFKNASLHKEFKYFVNQSFLDFFNRNYQIKTRLKYKKWLEID